MTVIAGRRYLLQIVVDREDLVAEVAADDELVRRLLLGGGDPMSGARRLLDGCHVVLEVVTRSTGDRAGAVLFSGGDEVSRHCFLTTFATAAYRGNRMFFEAVFLGLWYAFEEVGLQRIRFDVVELNLPQFGAIEGWPGIDKEGVRRDWLFHEGRFWDAHLYSMSRSGWASRAKGIAARLRAADHPDISQAWRNDRPPSGAG